MQALGGVPGNEINTSPQLLATAILLVLEDLPEKSRDGTEKDRVYQALNTRFPSQDLAVPTVIRSAMALVDLLEEGYDLAKELQSQGSQSTINVEAAKNVLNRFGRAIDEDQVAGVLLFLVLTPDSERYQLSIFVTAVKEYNAKPLDWQKVIRGFDRDGLRVSPGHVLALYSALAPIAHENTEFDIQLLWGGQWEYPQTLLSFALGFASLATTQLDATTIPRLRTAYDPRDCLDGSEEVVQFVDKALSDTMISLDAVTAIWDIVFNTDETPSPEDVLNAKQIISSKMATFLCSAAGIPKPWDDAHNSLMTKLLVPFFLKSQPEYKFVLHSLWKQDKHWLALKLIETHHEDPTKLPVLLDHAREHGWLDDLYTMMNGLGIDLAAFAHRKGYLDLDNWVEDKLSRGPDEFVLSISRFLVIKAEDEIRTAKHEQLAPRTVSLAMKTVHAMLEFLESNMKDRREELIALERQCMQAFPRLINYGEGFDDVIEANGQETNTLSQSTDAEMQDLYKRMYSTDLEVRDIIEVLRECKTSREPAKQDLFACMVHGLFDEYVCFHQYPLGPLATTAVLFGGIINYGLISNLTLNVGLEMVLEAVRAGSETSMFKFGLQALLHFSTRLEEWPEFCHQLVQIRGLQGTDAFSRAQESLRNGQNWPDSMRDTNGVNGLLDGAVLTNGNTDDFVTPAFQSVHADPLPKPELCQDPEEEVQDKVLFVLNNVSEQNLSSKIADLTDVLEPQHHHWFAQYLVEQRAKFQPNYQQLYLDLLGLLNEQRLWADVLQETYLSMQKILNAESTMKSHMERTQMRNLAQWLGSLTIARDKPIKHKNISFKGLLIEGWETQRLALVIPFTCVVLAEGVKSVVFKPPNPWIMEIIALLLELYDLPDLKIHQKFDIEVLLRAFSLPQKGEDMDRSNELQKRQQLFDDGMPGPIMPDGLESFDDLTIGSLSKGVRNGRFSPATIARSLPDLENLLVFPPSTGNAANHARLRQVVQNAVHRAIMEIIAPVVERSVTIATIATRDLIHKDYAQELDEDRVRDAAQKMARSLAGSLALVTCKEPLRMSMTNYIRLAANEAPDQAFPEGAILMCVNDNLDTACSIVEKQAEEQSQPEIDEKIENEIAKRRQHRVDFPNEPYRDAITSHWSSYIPEPYKQIPGGLNQEQLDIYLQFARQSRGMTNHIQTSSTDSGKQLPDVLQEPFLAISSIQTPGELPTIPLQQTHQQLQQARILPPAVSAARPRPHINGYLDAASIQDHVQELIFKMSRLTEDSADQHYRDLGRDDPIVEVVSQIHSLTVSATPNQDEIAWHIAGLVCSALYAESTNRLEVEVLVQVLQKACQVSLTTAKEVILLLKNQELEKVLNAAVTAALLESGLIEFVQVDLILMKAMHQQNPSALSCLSTLLDVLLFTKYPIAMRADFASSLGAVGELLSQQPHIPLAKSIMTRLKDAGIPESVDIVPDERSLQMQYIFNEWLTLFAHPDPTDTMNVAFVHQLNYRQILSSQEELVLFLRLCIDLSVDVVAHEETNPTMDPTPTYFNIDALAKLVVLLVKNQGEAEDDVKGSKTSYMSSIFSLLVLILNNHHIMRGEQFNQRVFYRLFSCILYNWYDLGRSGIDQDREMVLVFAEGFLLLNPQLFPGFAYSWLNLVSHRVFMPLVLKFFVKNVSGGYILFRAGD